MAELRGSLHSDMHTFVVNNLWYIRVFGINITDENGYYG